MLGENESNVLKRLENDNPHVKSTPEVNSAKPRDDFPSSLCIHTAASKGGAILGALLGGNKQTLTEERETETLKTPETEVAEVNCTN